MKVYRGRQGAVLIMTMMAICLLFMMISALMQTTGIGLNNATSFYDREAALQAAQSGLDYAATRLQADKSWRGDSNLNADGSLASSYKESGSKASGVQIYESSGNVIGVFYNKQTRTRTVPLTGNTYTTTAYEPFSAFRIKFSYETNNATDLDKLSCNRWRIDGSAEPAPYFPMQMPYVSVNNLSNMYAVQMFRANSNGKGIDYSTSDLEMPKGGSESATFACHVPPQRVTIIVEGVAGKGLRNCTNGYTVNNVINKGESVLARRYVEAYYSRVAPVLQGQVALAKGDVVFDVGRKVLARSNGALRLSAEDESTVPSPGSLRSSEGKVQIKRGVLNTYNGKVITKDVKNASFTSDNSSYEFLDAAGNKRKYTFTNTKEQASGPIEKIDEDHLIDFAGTSSRSIKPGFYQWHTTVTSMSGSPKYELRYYPDGCNIVSGFPSPVNSANYMIAVAGEAAEPAPGEAHPQISMGPEGRIEFIKDKNGNIVAPTLTLRGRLYCADDLVISSDVTEIPDVCPQIVMDYYSPKPSEVIEDTTPETGTGAQEIIPAGDPDASPTPEDCIDEPTPDPNEDVDAGGMVPDDGEGDMSAAEPKQEAGVLLAAGNCTLLSSVRGSGAIIAPNDNSNVSFVGETALDSGSDGVAIYAGQDVTLSSMEDILSHAPDGSGLSTQKSNFAGVINKHGDKEIKPNKELYTKCKSKGNEHDRKAFLTDYFATKYGVKAEVRNVLHDKHWTWDQYKVKVVFKGADGSIVGNPYIMHVGKHGVDTYIAVNNDYNNYHYHWKKQNHIVVHKASVEAGATDSMLSGMKVACYGDQTITGVIYARNNIHVNLGSNYNLNVNGALRAESGEITARCKNAELSFDESSLEKIMPGYSQLTCGLWNCW